MNETVAKMYGLAFKSLFLEIGMDKNNDEKLGTLYTNNHFMQKEDFSKIATMSAMDKFKLLVDFMDSRGIKGVDLFQVFDMSGLKLINSTTINILVQKGMLPEECLSNSSLKDKLCSCENGYFMMMENNPEIKNVFGTFSGKNVLNSPNEMEIANDIQNLGQKVVENSPQNKGMVINELNKKLENIQEDAMLKSNNPENTQVQTKNEFIKDVSEKLSEENSKAVLITNCGENVSILLNAMGKYNLDKKAGLTTSDSAGDLVKQIEKMIKNGEITAGAYTHYVDILGFDMPEITKSLKDKGLYNKSGSDFCEGVRSGIKRLAEIIQSIRSAGNMTGEVNGDSSKNIIEISQNYVRNNFVTLEEVKGLIGTFLYEKEFEAIREMDKPVAMDDSQLIQEDATTDVQKNSQLDVSSQTVDNTMKESSQESSKTEEKQKKEQSKIQKAINVGAIACCTGVALSNKTSFIDKLAVGCVAGLVIDEPSLGQVVAGTLLGVVAEKFISHTEDAIVMNRKPNNFN